MPQLKWFNRSGHELDAIDTPAPVLYPALSPDGKQLLVGGRDVDHGIWLVDVSRGVSTRIIWDGMSPLWSPDGAQIAFSADRAGANSLFTRPATRYTADTLVLRTGHNKILNDWSPDGRYILYTDLSPEAKNELWILPMFGDHKPRPFLQTPFDEAQGQISPDGHWVAYASDESGAWEVYLDSFPESSGKRILSIDGGVEPHWRKDGKELFYLSPDRNLMAVSITLGSSPKIERPKALFRAPLLPVPNILSNQLAVSADGQRFLIGSVGRTNGYEQITVLSSWPSLLVH
jgi:Tol biopolymer transport system component